MRSAAVPIAVSLVLIAALGAVHGYYTDRWGPSGQLEQALEGLPRVPATFGDWVSEETPLEADVMARGGIKGAIMRRYTNSRTGETVSFLIVCGRGGPISVHTPDVCYTGSGHKQLDKQQPREIDTDHDGKDSFYVARFTKPNAVVPTHLEIFWGWSRDGISWQAPENPRLALARSPALYKMYVVREFVPGSRTEALDTNQAFLQRALPVIRQTLPHNSQ